MKPGFPPRPPVERFWPKVNKDGPVPANRPELGPCWMWTAFVNPKGYGMFYAGARSMTQAHCWSYRNVVGPVPAGLELDHLCRVKACVNPAHLEPVTHWENMRRADAGAHMRARTHCPKGHPLAGDNLAIRSGHRRCRECSRESTRQSRARRKKVTS